MSVPLPPFWSLVEETPELDLYEPVVRHLLPRAQSAAAGKAPAAYVSLPGGADVEKFCRRFQGGPVPVLPLPAKVEDDPGRAAYIIEIKGTSGGMKGEVRAMILDYPATSPPRCGTPYPVPLRREGGRWLVVER